MRTTKKRKGIIAFMVMLTCFSALQGEAYVNFAEALQKSLYFYDAEKSGPGITGGKLEWRGNSEVADQWIPLTPEMTGMSQEFIDANLASLDPDGDGALDLSLGFHDAGDHVKFGLPQHYTISTLAWGYYEFKQAFIDTGEEEHILDILKWGTDYILKSVFQNSSGEVVAYCFQVGDGDVDHTYWGPPELQKPEKFPRPARFATAENPASDQAAGGASALASMYMVYKEHDTPYAAECLEKAEALYEFARANRGLGDSGGYYGSAYDQDELSWAATWLYMATGDMTYIDHITQVEDELYTGYMSRIINSTSNTWQNIWVHCWDVVWGGTFVILSTLFPDNEQFDYFASWNIEYWSGGSIPHSDPKDTAYLYQTPAGYGMINTWGSARYNTAAEFCALVYHKHKNRQEFADWALGQMEYLMGNNPNEKSYIVGYGPVYVEHPHHRAAHGSKTNSMEDPPVHRHILWGALAGGPDGDDVHVDETTDYVYNEVAIDYNAGFVGALAGFYEFYGRTLNHQPLDNFPPPEGTIDPFFVEGKLEQENTERTQITLKIHNETIHPPRFETALKCRYFFDISELSEVGQSIDDVRLEIMYDEQRYSYEGPTTITGPIHWEEDVYYVEFDYTGYEIYGDRDLHFALIVDLAEDFKSYWDPANDFSRPGIGEDDFMVSEKIAVYLDNALVFGNEPPFLGPTPTPSNGMTPAPTLKPAPELKVQYQAGDEDMISNQLTPHFNIVNTGRVPVNLSEVTVNYYYTKEGTAGETVSIDYALISDSMIKTNIMVGYIQLGFTEEAGILAPGKSTGNINLRISMTDYSMYDQADDYSHNVTYTVLTDHQETPLFINDKLVWGIPEGGVTPPPGGSGDVNQSGITDIVDALMTAQYYVGLPVPNFNKTAADVNLSGSIDIVDALIIAQYYVGLVSSLPLE